MDQVQLQAGISLDFRQFISNMVTEGGHAAQIGHAVSRSSLFHVKGLLQKPWHVAGSNLHDREGQTHVFWFIYPDKADQVGFKVKGAQDQTIELLAGKYLI